ncbi:TonB-dependent receptor [Helicobacter sp. 11S02629-2]|uniref:TonB-dependent receptor plug domain-containing protein n=1 Tax=Helicobacter sp. 11S02629-2 TaxID=1476195 RepID=UPI000BA75BAC|nr:TonB-dependent receptor [Helicobacter sp. 11S02629-2]PAF45554.1 hypothetical protein BKH40_01340 [Helicobacter sp. 11S02629-2]
MKLKTTLIFYFSLALLPLLANETREEKLQTTLLDALNVQASASPLDIEKQSKSISIIDKDYVLDSSGTGGVQDILASVPGVAYSRSGGINGQISIRGMNSNLSRSIVLIDGVRLSGRNTLELNMLDPNSIDSIEVLRGPASSIWGSDAMNGVINIKTRRFKGDISKPFKMDAKLRALEYDSVNNGVAGRLEAIGGGDGFDVLLGASGRMGQDYQSPLGRVKNSGFDSFGFDLNAGYTTKNDIRFYIQGRYQRVHSKRAGGLGAAPGSSYFIYQSEDPITEKYLRVGLTKYNLSFAKSMDAYLYVRKYDTDIYVDRRQVISGAKSLTHQRVYDSYIVGGRLSFESNLKAHDLIYGLDFYSSLSPTRVLRTVTTDKGVSSDTFTNRASTQTDFGAFIKDDYKITKRFTLQPSLRGDYILTTIGKKRYAAESELDSKLLDENNILNNAALTGALGGVTIITSNITHFFNISHNFRVSGPGTRMQTTPAGSSALATIANPNLKPEYSQTLESGFRFNTDFMYLNIAGFGTLYEDMISLKTFQPSSARPNNQYTNIGKALIAGAELDGGAYFFDDRLNLTYNLTYTYGQDLTSKKPLSYIAPLFGRIELSYKDKFGFIKLVERGFLGKSRIDKAQERPTKSYAMSDIYIGINLPFIDKDSKLIFGVENIFNQVGRNPTTVEAIAYKESLTNPLVEPGRNFSVKFASSY